MDKQNTCEGCIDRRPGCHAGCLEYIARKKSFREAAEIRQRETKIDEYEIDGQIKRNRSMKRRTK